MREGNRRDSERDYRPPPPPRSGFAAVDHDVDSRPAKTMVSKRMQPSANSTWQRNRSGLEREELN